MRIRLFILCVFAFTALSFYSLIPTKQSEEWGEHTPISNILFSLGDKKPLHYIDSIDSALAKKGEEIVTKGYTTKPNGKKTKIQSKHFLCTHCHTLTREDPRLHLSDPEGRLRYASQQNTPFLQGTTLYGLVNREHWYNDDYLKKYGNLVLPTHDTLINAIQLCATECSQGRALDEWEMGAVIHYFWSISYRLGDLELSSSELKTVRGNQLSNKEKSSLIKSKYLLASPATFLEPIPIRDRAYGKQGDSKNGKLIYELSCLHCHSYATNVADLKLDQTTLTFKMFRKNLKKNSDFSLYHIIRKGTPSDVGYRPYMPHYTEERMSDQQLEDLVAYIIKESK